MKISNRLNAIINKVIKTSLLIVMGFVLVGYGHAAPTAADVAQAQLVNNNFIENKCSAKAKIFISVQETLADTLKVDPRNMALNRVEIKTDAWDGRKVKRCIGFFYHNQGVTKCDLEFDQAGTIANACHVGDRDTYSENLRNTASNPTDVEIEARGKLQRYSTGTKYDEYGMPIQAPNPSGEIRP